MIAVQFMVVCDECSVHKYFSAPEHSSLNKPALKAIARDYGWSFCTEHTNGEVHRCKRCTLNRSLKTKEQGK